jgi:hypothetical protein
VAEQGSSSRGGGVARRRDRLNSPLAFLIYAVAGVIVVAAMAYASQLPAFGLDGLQLTGLWVGLVLELFVLLGRWGRSRTGGPDRLRHRVLWTAVVGALVFSFLLNYDSYRALLDRLGQLHGDITSQTEDIHRQVLSARYDAEQLSDDLRAWSTASEATRASAELRVTSDLTALQLRAQETGSHLDGIVTRLGAKTPSGVGGFSLDQSTSVRNLAEDAVQENTRMVKVLQSVTDDWTQNRTKPGVAEEIQYAVNPQLWLAIDNTSNAIDRFETSFGKASNIPVSDLFAVIAFLNLSFVLFPWLLLLLFVSGRRELRIRRMYRDLWALGGETNALLVRVLEGVSESKLDANGYTDPEVQRALEDRTFSDVEYLLSLSMLTVLITAGWHLVLYPAGGLGLATLVGNGVSVRDFAMYLVGNLNVVTLGFLGAYFYGVGMLLRRFFASDLYPSAFLQLVERLIAVVVISLVVTILLPIATAVFPNATNLTSSLSGLPTPPDGGKALDASAAIAGALAFFFGVLPREFLSWLTRLVSNLPFGLKGNNQPPVAELEGVDIWIEGRLAEEGIETVQAMATADIERLVRRTYFPTALITCWVDQALLHVQAGNRGSWMEALRSAGIHTASDLIEAVGYPVVAAAKAADRSAVLFEDMPPKAVEHLQTATKTATPEGLPTDVIFEMAKSLWSKPNLLYIFNYKDAHQVSRRVPALVPPPLAPPPGGEEVAPGQTNGHVAGVS